MNARKRTLIERIFGVKRDDDTKRVQAARIEKVERDEEAAEERAQERKQKVKRAREETDASAESVCEQTISLSDILAQRNGRHPKPA